VEALHAGGAILGLLDELPLELCAPLDFVPGEGGVVDQPGVELVRILVDLWLPGQDEVNVRLRQPQPAAFLSSSQQCRLPRPPPRSHQQRPSPSR
jgi:hypothetical protein